LAALGSHSLPTKPIKTGVKPVIPTSTAKKFAQLEQQIRHQQFIIDRQTNSIRILEDQLQKSISERLKCLKCRIKLRELRRNDGGTC